MVNSQAFLEIMNNTQYTIQAVSEERKHILSHQILFAKFYHINVGNDIGCLRGHFERIKKTNLQEKPIPKLIENYLNEETNLLSLLSA